MDLFQGLDFLFIFAELLASDLMMFTKFLVFFDYLSHIEFVFDLIKFFTAVHRVLLKEVIDDVFNFEVQLLNLMLVVRKKDGDLWSI